MTLRVCVCVHGRVSITIPYGLCYMSMWFAHGRCGERSNQGPTEKYYEALRRAQAEAYPKASEALLEHLDALEALSLIHI